MAILSGIQANSFSFALGVLSTAITVSSYDTSKSILFFSHRGAHTDRSANLFIMGQKSDSTTLFFQKTSSGQASTVLWNLASFSEGISVQEGTTDLVKEVTSNVVIIAVDSRKTFLFYTIMSSDTTSGNFDNNESFRGFLTTPTNLLFTRQGGSGGVISWQVVEYEGCTVQSGTGNLSTDSLNLVLNIPIAVDTSKTALFVNNDHFQAVSRISNMGQMPQFVNQTTILIQRDSAAKNANIVHWQTVEFGDGTSVQSNTAYFGTGTLSSDMTLKWFSSSRAIPMVGSPYQFLGKGGAGQPGDFSFGNISFTVALLGNTGLRVERGLGILNSCNLFYQVVEFNSQPREEPYIIFA